ncbi:unnamed protein product [Gongylonema pulchrum]|uniref:Katanin p60 ATPase-containing subunit A1 n=1 Tax=Gongylonema pulchrum TaxID=637853 RepID=A0A183DV33_9BILA|nr:unnamed protein product [Gongylonema pulchrum]
MALAALSLDGVRIGDLILSVKLLTADWMETECAQMSNLMRNRFEDTVVECSELGNADNFEINDGDVDVAVKGTGEDRTAGLKCVSPSDGSEANLSKLTVPSVATRSVSSPLLNDMQMYPADNIVELKQSVLAPSSVEPPSMMPVECNVCVNVPPPVPPRKFSAKK